MSALLLALSLFAYEHTKDECGAAFYWGGDTIDYDVVFTDPAQAEFSAAARRAWDQWGGALAGRLVPVYRGPSIYGSHSDDDLCTVELASSFPYADADTTIALTVRFYDCDTGSMHDADIILNGEKFHFAPETKGAIDTESAIVHEVGHVFGLGHTCGDAGSAHPSCFNLPPNEADAILEAVMSPSLPTAKARRELRDDDRQGVRAIYSVSSTVPVPKISAYSIDCPSGTTFVTGANLLEAFVPVLRMADGSTLAHSWSRISDARADVVLPEGADLLVIDPRTRAYGSIVSPARPSCEPGPDPGPGPDPSGCECTSTSRQLTSLLPMLVLMALAVLRRRAWLPLLLLVFLPTEARAFKCSRTGSDIGPSLYWPKREIPWVVNDAFTSDIPDDDLTLEQLKLSFQEWENVDCSDITLPYQGALPGLKAGFNDQSGAVNYNVVVFLDHGWAYDPGVIAVTTNAYQQANGEILDSDIEINSDLFQFVNVDVGCDGLKGQMDLRNAITHEVGHIVGLDHPPATIKNRETTMFASAPPCETKKRSLHEDDIMGICSIYPTGIPVHQCFPPDGPSFVKVGDDDGFGGCTAIEKSSLMLSWIAVAFFVSILRKKS